MKTFTDDYVPFVDASASVKYSQEGAGWLFTYVGDYGGGHAWYADAEGKPFATQEAARKVALDPESEDVSEFGTGVSVQSL